MSFKKWVKSIQTAGYNGASTVLMYFPCLADFSQSRPDWLGKHVFKKATPVSNKLSSW